ncbi:MAG: zinc ribbon domain-containing protein [Eubacteriales bacterium]|nr:zinc ribbon domain-containing protein [Eubacteriales bacterium]
MGIIANIGGIAALIAIVILTVILWTTFHNFVTRIYFGGMSNMIFTIIMEFVVCGMISTWIVSMVGGLILFAVQGIGSIVMFLLRILISLIKIAAVIAAIGGAVYGIYKLIGKVSGRGRDESSAQAAETSGTEPQAEQMPGEAVPDEMKQVEKDGSSAETEQGLRCPSCGSVIRDDDVFCEVCGQKLQKETQEGENYGE